VNKEQVRNRIEEIGIIPAIRLSSAEDALFAAEAVSSSGIPIVEVTMTVPGAIDVISQLVKSNPELVAGAGTVYDVETAKRCLGAGAVFLTSPGFDRAVVEFALRENTVVFPGALSPTEILAAWKSGADFVKVFPCSAVGGATYIKAMKSPFPSIPLIASGGVNQQPRETSSAPARWRWELAAILSSRPRSGGASGAGFANCLTGICRW
jgi:2-dehydro-3-deoxyphosphogluconate aldolase/(4S)-4-hydroxy-2-oxoglutarate aldolase